MPVSDRTQRHRNKRLREELEREDAWQRHTAAKFEKNANPKFHDVHLIANEEPNNDIMEYSNDNEYVDDVEIENFGDDVHEDIEIVDSPVIGNLSMKDLIHATGLTRETIEVNVGEVFRLDDYQPLPTYHDLRNAKNGQLGHVLFTNQSSKYSLLDTVLFFNGLLQRYPTTPLDAIDTILKWIHNMTNVSNVPESLSGLNECITTTERIISVPFCSTPGCGHIFNPNLDEMQTCPKCQKNGYKQTKKTEKSKKKFNPIATFYYSPVIWKEMDMIIHNIQFRKMIQQLLPKRTNDSNLISDFVDADQCVAFVTNNQQQNSQLCLALAEMVDGISRSLCTPENMTVQLIRYTSLPLEARNKYINMFVAAICASENQPHANVFRRMLIGELQYSQQGIKVPSIPIYTLRRFLVSKHSDTKSEEYVNGCQCYNSTFGCSRCKIEPLRASNKKTAHYDVGNAMRRDILSHAQDSIQGEYGVKYAPIDILLYPDFDGMKGTSQDILHPYSVVFGSLLPFFKLYQTEIINLYDSIKVAHDAPYKYSFIYAKHWKCQQKITFLHHYAVPILGSFLDNDHVLLKFVCELRQQLQIIHTKPINLSLLKDSSEKLKHYWKALYNYGLPAVTNIF